MKTKLFAKLVAFFMLLTMIFTSIPVTVGAENTLDDHIKVLFVGNSYSDDATDGGYFASSMLYKMLKSMAGDRKVTLGLVYEGSKTLGWYASAAKGGHQVTFHLAAETALWGTPSDKKLDEILRYTDWDIVVLQPYNTEMTTGASTGFNDGVFLGEFAQTSVSLPYLLDVVAANAPSAEAFLYLPFAATVSKELVTSRNDFATYAEQMRTLETYKGKTSGLGITKVIPVGTAVHTARSTYLGALSYNEDIGLDNKATTATDPQIGLQRDGVHLSFSVGRYLANLVSAETIIPENERAAGYKLPEMRESAAVGKLPTDYTDVIRLAADAAHASAAATGRTRYLSTVLTGLTEDPLTVTHGKLTTTPIYVKEAADKTELKALIAAEVKKISGYDVNVDVTLSGDYTAPSEGKETTVNAVILVSHGYSGNFVIQTTVVSKYGYGTYVPQFDDVSEGAWYYDGVIYAATKGYMSGTNTEKTLFSPNMEFTREQFVQLLFNMEGLDKNDYAGATGFSDVPAGKWYSAAVKWAKEAGVSDGIGGGKFGLGGKVTREQLAMFLKNYAELKGSSTAARADLTLFSDASSVSGWAKESVSFAVAEELLGSTSTTANVLSPGRVAKRCEIARVTMTYDAYLAK